jgi:hypothetical protein
MDVVWSRVAIAAKAATVLFFIYAKGWMYPV